MARVMKASGARNGRISTVRATRAATENQLLADALHRADVMIAEGVSCIEIKSGHGLSLDTELRMLRVARSIAAQRAHWACL